jgi:CBS domain containing-hemolysin-like protein
VLRYQILSAAAEDKDDVTLKELVLPIQAVPASLSVAKGLQEFISLRDHILLVLDEYGGTAGIITMEDALESLLGIEIVDESDIIEDMRQLAKQRYERQRRATAQLEKLKAQSKDSPPGDSPTTSTAPSS